MSGHAAVFSVRCSKFVDIVSNNRSSLSAQHQVHTAWTIVTCCQVTHYYVLQGLVTVNLNFVSSDGFIKFVHFVYTGQLELGTVSPYDVMAVSSLFGVETLTR